MIRENRNTRRLALLLSSLTFLALAAAGLIHDRPSLAAPAILPPHRAEHRAPIARLDHLRRDHERYVADVEGGGRAELTLDPRLQEQVDRVLEAHHGAYASAVVVRVDDGRVLAMAGRSTEEPARGVELALKPWAPAASVFKIVTASALVGRGVQPERRVCYHDGIHSVEASNLASHPRIDGMCNSFAYGLAKSQNAIIARLANDHLDARALGRVAHALGFGQAIPFDAPVAPSAVEIPHERGLAFARVAAGFWQTSLSPLHGAYLAATIARGGVTPPLHVIERVVRGDEVIEPEHPRPRRVLDESVARTVGEMMVGTTRFGTARLGFHDHAGRALLPVDVAGKTGSLNRKPQDGPFLAYSWFVGYAPADHPEVAVAVLLGNESGHDAKAHKVAREILQGYFAGRAKKPLVAAR